MSLVLKEEVIDLTLVVKTRLWNELATLTTLEEVTEGVLLAVALDVTMSTSPGEDA